MGGLAMKLARLASSLFAIVASCTTVLGAMPGDLAGSWSQTTAWTSTDGYKTQKGCIKFGTDIQGDVKRHYVGRNELISSSTTFYSPNPTTVEYTADVTQLASVNTSGFTGTETEMVVKIKAKMKNPTTTYADFTKVLVEGRPLDQNYKVNMTVSTTIAGAAINISQEVDPTSILTADAKKQNLICRVSTEGIPGTRTMYMSCTDVTMRADCPKIAPPTSKFGPNATYCTIEPFVYRQALSCPDYVSLIEDLVKGLATWIIIVIACGVFMVICAPIFICVCCCGMCAAGASAAGGGQGGSVDGGMEAGVSVNVTATTGRL